MENTKKNRRLYSLHRVLNYPMPLRSTTRQSFRVDPPAVSSTDSRQNDKKCILLASTTVVGLRTLGRSRFPPKDIVPLPKIFVRKRMKRSDACARAFEDLIQLMHSLLVWCATHPEKLTLRLSRRNLLQKDKEKERPDIARQS